MQSSIDKHMVSYQASSGSNLQHNDAVIFYHALESIYIYIPVVKFHHQRQRWRREVESQGVQGLADAG